MSGHTTSTDSGLIPTVQVEPAVKVESGSKFVNDNGITAIKKRH